MLILGAALLHALWNAVVKGSGEPAILIGLIAAYQMGDFLLVYPIARGGVAPLLVASGGMIFAGEYLSSSGWAGLLLVCFAVAFLVFARGKVPGDPRAVLVQS